jgi:hypothetical protein
MAKAHNARAEDEAKEIKSLNRSIFRPTFTWNKKAKRDAEEARILNRHIEEREEREASRADALAARNRVEGAIRKTDKERSSAFDAPRGNKLAERQKYQFEATESDDEVETEIDGNLDELAGLAGRLNILAKAAGSEIRQQNEKLDDLHDKTDRLDTKLVQNTQRLARWDRLFLLVLVCPTLIFYLGSNNTTGNIIALLSFIRLPL